VEERTWLHFTDDQKLPKKLDSALKSLRARGSSEEEIEGDEAVDEVTGHEVSSEQSVH
jgi:hypothetical protein